MREDSEFNTITELLDAAKAAPGDMKSSGTGQGGIWHLAMAGLLVESGLGANDVPWVPSKGSAAGLQDLVSGGVDLVACSHPEVASLIAAGKVKSLAVMSDEPLADVPDLPTVRSETGIDLLVGSWRGIAAPAGVGEDVVAAPSAAMETAWNSDAFVAFMKERALA